MKIPVFERSLRARPVIVTTERIEVFMANILSSFTTEGTEITEITEITEVSSPCALCPLC